MPSSTFSPYPFTRVARSHHLHLLAILGLVFLLSACTTVDIKPSTPGSAASTGKIEHEQRRIDEALALGPSQPSHLGQFLELIAQKHSIPLANLKEAFADSKTIPSVKKLVMPPPPGFQKNWRVYRGRFVEPRRLNAGETFWKQHQAFIRQSAEKYGVPADVIVAIIGVETIYGRHMGTFPVRDTLVTLGFQYPPVHNQAAREKLFKDQLEDLILLCWSKEVKPQAFKACLNQTGSYAGAIGLPQFMPGSIRRFAVDGDGNGQINLRESTQDAIASVAHFLQQHGWVPHEPIYLPIANTRQAQMNAARLADGKPETGRTLGELFEAGVIEKIPQELNAQTPALIVDLPSPDGQGGTEVRYVVGLRNFIAICEYNRSFFYAQSVAEFAEALQSPEPSNPVKQKTKAQKNKAKKSNQASRRENTR